MRPNDLYNWYCVVNSFAVIFRLTTQLRVPQAAACTRNSLYHKRKRINKSDVAISSQVGYEDGSIVNPQSGKTSRFVSTSLQDVQMSYSQVDKPVPTSEPPLQVSKVPSSRLGRLFHYGGECSPWPSALLQLTRFFRSRRVSELRRCL